MDKLLDFPGDVFIPPEAHFFQLVKIAVTHDSILIITKLWTDKDGRERGMGSRLDIYHFKDWVRQNLLEQYQPLFDCVSKKIRKDINYLNSAAKNIEGLRDNFVAHLIFDDKQRLIPSVNTKVS
ncbi:unnamed protein product, partial [marine sediment metagenome]